MARAGRVVDRLRSHARAGRELQHLTQGNRACQNSQGYRSTEWDRDGMRFGQDNQRNRWTTSRWQGIETTTVEPQGR